MSADNGIYVLYTESEEGPEYRVAYAHAIDNIYGEYDDVEGRYTGDVEAIKETFGNSEVFYSLDEALDTAENLSYDYEYLEEGICVISNFSQLGNIFKAE